MEWSNWNLINVVFIFFSAGVSAWCFKNENPIGGWFNLFASALNSAIVAARLI